MFAQALATNIGRDALLLLLLLGNQVRGWDIDVMHAAFTDALLLLGLYSMVVTKRDYKMRNSRNSKVKFKKWL
jgi:hypothetical protein